MRRQYGQSGMSLMEVLAALAIILVLISTLIGVGSYVRTRADLDLTKGMLETLSTALEQYYSDFGDFPFVTEKDYNDNGFIDPYDESHLEFDLNGTVVPDNAIDSLEYQAASSAALFYFLDKNPSSRATVETVPNTLVTNKDDNGDPIKINIGGTEYDLPRYVDPWKRGPGLPGMSIRYEYLPGTAFPVLTSAGPDGEFDTPDDVTSK